MCGISFSLRPATLDDETSAAYQALASKLSEANGRRGPDAQRLIREECTTAHGKFIIEAFASELQLRGKDSVLQPHEREGNLLCWNGEIFSGLDVKPNENDGSVLADHLSKIEHPDQIRDILAQIEGPYAFVYYHKSSSRVFWGRDPLGRRSLLIHEPTSAQPYLLLMSVGIGEQPGYALREVAADRLYSMDVNFLSPEEFYMSASKATNIVPREPLHPDFEVPLYHCLQTVNTELPPSNWETKQDEDSVPEGLQPHIHELIAKLDNAVRRQVITIPPSIEHRARVAVLFSGGIDSAAVALLAHRHVPLDEPIDLLNVAFENPFKLANQRQGPHPGSSKKKRRPVEETEIKPASFLVPDRVTGFQEVDELRRICPGRAWNFVEVNIPYQEAQSAKPTIAAVMYPSQTNMDMSLAQALYFAARGEGQVAADSSSVAQPYKTPARVLLNGLGSDELLGGYGRHRSAYTTGGWKAVIDELQLELDRIPTRNLGRDDRVVSSHGKEARHPFLDLDVVSYLSRLPVHKRFDPVAPLGVGDKLLLRLAMRQLGAVEASARKKRAMQFGSHSARMEGQRHGEDKYI